MNKWWGIVGGTSWPLSLLSLKLTQIEFVIFGWNLIGRFIAANGSGSGICYFKT